MKKNKLFLLMLILILTALFSVGCNDKKNQETVDYILSQPKDPDLAGWWKRNTENDSVFWYIKKTGTISELEYRDGNVYNDSEDWYYWYTEKKDDKQIFHCFHPRGWIDGKDYSHVYYKIENDSFWKSAGIEGDIQPTELYLFAVRATAPQGYENW
jgi:hypothetical protein